MSTLTKRSLAKIARKADAHKGENGTVLVVGGSEDFVGAPLLAAMAALRCGADLVKVAAPERAAWTMNARSADLITLKLPGKNIAPQHLARIQDAAKSADVVLIGNGMGLRSDTQKVARALCALPRHKVLDADALKAVETKNLRNAILTPHGRELEVLLRNNKTTAAKIAAQGNAVVAKGRTDRIFVRGKTFENKTGNARMAVGGTGDVLAGLCAGLLAQYRDIEKAAVAAAFINGIAGDRLFGRMGFGFTAGDLAAEIPAAMKALRIHQVVRG